MPYFLSPSEWAVHLGLVVHTCNPSVQKPKAGIQDHSWLHHVFEANVEYIVKPCLKPHSL